MNHTVLIADDEKEIRDLLRLYLENEGYKIIEAADGMEAINAVKEKHPVIGKGIRKFELSVLDIIHIEESLKMLRPYRCDHTVMRVHYVAYLFYIPYMPCSHLTDEYLMGRLKRLPYSLYDSHRCIIALGRYEHIKAVLQQGL